MKKDKILHFAVCLIASLACYIIVDNYLGLIWAVVISFFITMIIIGVGKELLDIKKTGFSWWDLLADLVGCIAGITIGILT